MRGEMSLPALVIFAWGARCWATTSATLLAERLDEQHLREYFRYDAATVFFARFFSILRQLNDIVAGTLRMPWWRFLLFNAAGAAVWVTAWIFAGYYFSQHTAVIAGLAQHIGLVC